MLDAQRLPFVHAQRACALPIAIAFWPVLLAVTGLAIDLFSMHGHSGAVQILLADHWGGDSGMVRCSYGLTHAEKETSRVANGLASRISDSWWSRPGLLESGSVPLRLLYPGTYPSLSMPHGSEATD